MLVKTKCRPIRLCFYGNFASFYRWSLKYSYQNAFKHWLHLCFRTHRPSEIIKHPWREVLWKYNKFLQWTNLTHPTYNVYNCLNNISKLLTWNIHEYKKAIRTTAQSEDIYISNLLRYYKWFRARQDTNFWDFHK